MAPLTAPVKWAQRPGSIFLTIDIPDVDEKNASIELTDEKLVFSGKTSEKEYNVEIEFLHPIDSKNEETKYGVKPRTVSFFLLKKTEESWPRLLKDKVLQKTNVKCDFDKWIDSDEEEEAFNVDGMGGMPPGMGGAAGGMPPGMGGMPGMENMDMAKMMEQMKNMQGGADGGPGFDPSDDDSSDDSDDDDSDDDVDADAAPELVKEEEEK